MSYANNRYIISKFVTDLTTKQRMILYRRIMKNVLEDKGRAKCLRNELMQKHGLQWETDKRICMMVITLSCHH